MHTDTGTEEKFLQDFRATKHTCALKTDALQNFPLPALLGDHPHGLTEGGELLSCPVEELHTWLGVVAHDGLSVFYEESAVDSYVSTFVPPEPHSECKHGIRTRWTGTVPMTTVVSLLEKIRFVTSGNNTNSRPNL